MESPFTRAVVLPTTCPGPVEMKRGNHVVRRFTPEEDALLLTLEAEGLSYTEIGRRLERPHTSISGRLMTLARHEERRAEAGEDDTTGENHAV